jgi:hypothetical protein
MLDNDCGGAMLRQCMYDKTDDHWYTEQDLEELPNNMHKSNLSLEHTKRFPLDNHQASSMIVFFNKPKRKEFIFGNNFKFKLVVEIVRMTFHGST